MGLATKLVTAAAVTLGLSSATYAADLVVEPPIYEPVPISIWEGAYVGVFAGGGWASVDFSDEFDDEEGLCFDDSDDNCGVDLGGWLIGLQGGYNWAVGNGFVLGVAGDIAWADLSSDDDNEVVDEVLDLANSVEWEGSLRVLAGYDAGAFMPYLTGGVAFAGAHHQVDWWDGDEWFSEDHGTTYVGGTIGIGVMYAVTDNIALDLQYRHSWYGGDAIDWDNDELDWFDPNLDVQTDRVTVGLNFTF